MNDSLEAGSKQGAHTQEPWTTWYEPIDGIWRIQLKLPNNSIIIGWAGKEEDASRIVACVNACKGVDTDAIPELPGGTVSGMIELMRESVEILRERRERGNALVAALRKVIEVADGCHDDEHGTPCPDLDAERALLIKVQS